MESARWKEKLESVENLFFRRKLLHGAHKANIYFTLFPREMSSDEISNCQRTDGF